MHRSPMFVCVLTACAAVVSACSSATPGVESSPDAAVGDAPSDAASETTAGDETDLTPDNPSDAAPADNPDATTHLAVGGKAVTRTNLNLRDGAGTSHAILEVMPCGSKVDVVGGPTSGWWNVTFSGKTGWASGSYLVRESAFNPSDCAPASDGGSSTDSSVGVEAGPTSGGLTAAQDAIFALAKPAVGYSYYWGHGSWTTDGTQPGSCSGSCPSCSHSGQYGADCSGFVAKVWQVPSPSAVTDDLHPYSTYNFVNDATHWSVVDRAKLQPADALTYNSGGHGHIFLFESGSDPWGSLWAYEARGCATGIVHNLRTAGSAYIAIRREGM